MVQRRDFLWRMGGGLGGIALADLLARDGLLADTAAPHPDGPHHPARARRVVQIFLSGAASQCDTFDYKPLLEKKHGQPFLPNEKIELFQSKPGAVMKSPWKWRQWGETGRWVSSLLPELGRQVDRMALVYSMTSTSNVHGPATFLQASGFSRPGFPSMGAWISYGLGSLNDNLPTFVVLPDARGYAPNGPKNWTSGFLPAAHQGTLLRPTAQEPIADLFPPKKSFVTAGADADGLALLKELNQHHQQLRPGDSRLEARIASYELAARLQRSAPEVLDLRSEGEAARKLYGLDDPTTADFGRNCLVARRLLERGVRFIQLWNGADNGFPRRNWDSHEDLARDHATMGKSFDRPAAALLADLAARGLLEDTIVLCATEFGRMPCAQGTLGRDHNPHAFTVWLAGGGIRGGATYGQSDEWSFKVAEKPAQVYDIHATVLHLLGIDHKRLVYRHNGIDRRLTDVHGRVLTELLA